MEKILIASDHAGFKLKEALKKHLSGRYQVIDLGTTSEDSVDYPDFGKKLGQGIADRSAEKGILVCGSGIGIAIAANRNPAVRAVVLTDEESTRLCRQHNNANVASFGARLIDEQKAVKLLDIFLSTPFEGGRHEGRVNKLSC